MELNINLSNQFFRTDRLGNCANYMRHSFSTALEVADTLKEAMYVQGVSVHSYGQASPIVHGWVEFEGQIIDPTVLQILSQSRFETGASNIRFFYLPVERWEPWKLSHYVELPVRNTHVQTGQDLRYYSPYREAYTAALGWKEDVDKAKSRKVLPPLILNPAT